ncbi:2-dehydropantoate 2-reductase [Marinobacter sp. NP-4(2019)]|uniref:2-dehydropantoate 2-reductase n=1 Tax=Marinobacter sp. NP-4(2019) TaxID=2488665 RepID=UPI000FC3DC25|nr:2-dehydropantoate 2-reductase [Marinobacter sp. NP-4(2019)]AZT83162.1 2-dehydropantoate 2-reductase [Marinobacter sp. NP-4(2019)]
MTKTTFRIVIFGAGSVGCYLGGRLLSADADVIMVGRPGMQERLQTNPLVVTDYKGFNFRSQIAENRYVCSAEAAKEADLVLVTVKSAATSEAGKQLAPWVPTGVPVISLQNGISNASQLREAMPEATVLAGMVPFNVLQQQPGHFHQGTEGHLMAELHPSLNPALPWFEKAGLPLKPRTDIESVMWSKLLLNLNNPINALSGVPLLEELSQRDYRRCLALAQRETLQLLKAAGIPTVKLTSLPMNLIPPLMSTPDWLFTRLAKQMLTIDPVARSSMWEDLQAGRPTEIDWINGEVVKLAKRLGKDAPVNRKLVELMHEREQKPATWSAGQLLNALRAVR